MFGLVWFILCNDCGWFIGFIKLELCLGIGLGYGEFELIGLGFGWGGM